MTTQNSGNQKFTNNTDGWDLAGGTTARKVTVSGADIAIVGSGSATMTFPNTNATMARTDTGQTFTGTNTFDGATTFNTGLLPDADDGAYLGTAGTARSDLFLAEGGVINRDNSDATCTQSGNTITWAGITAFNVGTSTAVGLGTIEVGHASDTTIARVSAGVASIEGSNIMTVGSADTVTGVKTLGTTGAIKLGSAVTDKCEIRLNNAALNDETRSGTVLDCVAGATLAVGDVCYLKTADGERYLNDGILDGTDTGCKLKLGICVLAATDGQATKMLLNGLIASAAFPTFTVGAPVYLDDTAGDLVVAQPTTTNFVIRMVGYAVSATVLHFNPDNSRIVHV